ncbi:hypothetical protein [Sphingobium sp. TCM1]|uniref:hypothetical protein n=1 Tax=Sphingobium sp. TCM1 TaxID=453246 RepID=UPI001E51232B|nr:hypothetical protein [Sphingobium sp. TCM1]
MPFELRQALRQGRLRKTNGIGGRRDAAMLFDGDQSAQVAQVYVEWVGSHQSTGLSQVTPLAKQILNGRTIKQMLAKPGPSINAQ